MIANKTNFRVKGFALGLEMGAIEQYNMLCNR